MKEVEVVVVEVVVGYLDCSEIMADVAAAVVAAFVPSFERYS